MATRNEGAETHKGTRTTPQTPQTTQIRPESVRHAPFVGNEPMSLSEKAELVALSTPPTHSPSQVDDSKTYPLNSRPLIHPASFVSSPPAPPLSCTGLATIGSGYKAESVAPPGSWKKSVVSDSVAIKQQHTTTFARSQTAVSASTAVQQSTLHSPLGSDRRRLSITSSLPLVQSRRSSTRLTCLISINLQLLTTRLRIHLLLTTSNGSRLVLAL
jgi:hypothetical protein